jgi:hypothetical protein
MLSFGKETSMTIEYFLDEANKWMSDKEYSRLTSVDVNDFTTKAGDPRILKAYKLFEERLKTDIALWRDAQKRDLEYKPANFPVSVLKEGNPLDIELRLMQMRWEFIDDMERDHHFDFGLVVLYYLKLQLLKRYFTFNKEEGLKKFQKLYEVDV